MGNKIISPEAFDFSSTVWMGRTRPVAVMEASKFPRVTLAVLSAAVPLFAFLSERVKARTPPATTTPSTIQNQSLRNIAFLSNCLPLTAIYDRQHRFYKRGASQV